MAGRLNRGPKIFRWLQAAACSALLVSGCASYDGRGLVAGRSSAAEVEAQMGRPAEKLPGAEGGSVWYYPRGVESRHLFAVRIGPDGVLRGIEQRLTRANVAKLLAGSSTLKDTRELFGAPFSTTYFPRQARLVWEYKLYDYEAFRVLWVQFSDDGIVREVFEGHDYQRDPPIGSSRD